MNAGEGRRAPPLMALHATISLQMSLDGQTFALLSHHWTYICSTLSLSLSLCQSVCLSVSLSLSFCLCDFLSVFLSHFLSLSRFCLTLKHFNNPSINYKYTIQTPPESAQSHLPSVHPSVQGSTQPPPPAARPPRPSSVLCRTPHSSNTAHGPHDRTSEPSSHSPLASRSSSALKRVLRGV